MRSFVKYYYINIVNQFQHFAPSLLQPQSTVSEAKKKDLIWMCLELIIPQDYYQLYHDLVISTANNDEDTELIATATDVTTVEVPENSVTTIQLRSMTLKTKGIKFSNACS